MIAKEVIKKKFAKEFLLLFACVILIILVLMTLLIRNSFFEHKKQEIVEEISNIDKRLNRLPTEKAIQELYRSLRFFKTFHFSGKSYTIPDDEESSFLIQFPKAQRAPIHPNGYFNSREYYEYFPISAKDELHAALIKSFGTGRWSYMFKDDQKKYLEKNYKLIVRTPSIEQKFFFESIDYNNFKELLKSKEYRDTLFKYHNSYYVKVDRSTFEWHILNGLKYNNDIGKAKDELNREKISKKKSISIIDGNILNAKQIRVLLLNIAVIIGIVIYPL